VKVQLQVRMLVLVGAHVSDMHIDTSVSIRVCTYAVHRFMNVVWVLVGVGGWVGKWVGKWVGG